ncbi:MAG: hypothetical protein ACR2NG_03620 [Acidimicrobiia bacterium]
MGIAILFAAGLAAIIVWWVVGTLRQRRFLSGSEEAAERRQRKQAAARRELLRQFPDRDPENRTRRVMATRDLTPGDLLRASVHGRGHVDIESPTTTAAQAATLGLEYVVFTGFSSTTKKGFVLINICDLDGYGSTSFTQAQDSQVIAYAEECPSDSCGTGRSFVCRGRMTTRGPNCATLELRIGLRTSEVRAPPRRGIHERGQYGDGAPPGRTSS